MHLSDGVLGMPALVGGGLVALAGTAIGLRRLPSRDVPQAALLASAFYVGSLVHVPVGVASVHLVLNGLLGVLLGWAAFPVILVALFLQAVMFQYGGLSVLGVNTAVMALPAVAAHYAYRALGQGGGGRAIIAAGLCGGGAVGLGGILLAAILLTAGEPFLPSAAAVLAIHLPVMAVEGIMTAGVVRFLLRTRPGMLTAAMAPAHTVSP